MLVSAIKKRKAECWRKLCDEIDMDIWGQGFKTFTKKFGKQAPEGPKDQQEMENIVKALFPQHLERVCTEYQVSEREIPLFTVEELNLEAKSLEDGKATGPDRIPTEILKIIVEKHPFLLLNMFNACSIAGIFSSRWKIQRLVLLDKGKGPPIMPSSYRPLCLLDTAGKLYE